MKRKIDSRGNKISEAEWIGVIFMKLVNVGMLAAIIVSLIMLSITQMLDQAAVNNEGRAMEAKIAHDLGLNGPREPAEAKTFIERADQ